MHPPRTRRGKGGFGHKEGRKYGWRRGGCCHLEEWRRPEEVLLPEEEEPLREVLAEDLPEVEVPLREELLPEADWPEDLPEEAELPLSDGRADELLWPPLPDVLSSFRP